MPTRVLPTYEIPTRKTVASDVSYTSTTTLATITGVSVNMGGTASVVADLSKSSTYEVYGVLIIDGDSAGDIKVQLSLPSGTTFKGLINTTYHDGTASLTIQTAASGTKEVARIEGVLTTGTTQGTVALQAAQAASSATATKVYAGSYLKFNKI